MQDELKKEKSLETVYDFYRQIRQISRSIERYRDKVLSDLPLTGSQVYALYSIYKLEHCTNAELSKHSGLAKNSITNLVKHLTKEGYIKQYRSESDGRVITLSISDKGEMILNQLADSFELEPRLLDLVDVITKKMNEDDNIIISLNKLFDNK